MPLTLVTGPTVEPITVEEVRLHVLQGQDVDDAYLGGIVIPAARDRMELATGRAAMTQTWDLVCDQFPGDGYIEISKPPLQSVTHLKYKDTAGTLQTWAATNYIVDAPAGPRSGGDAAADRGGVQRGEQRLVARPRVGVETYGVAIDEARGLAFIVTRIDQKLRVVDLKPRRPVYHGELTTSLLFIPTEIAIVPGIPGAVRLIVTDVGSRFVGVVNIPDTALPLQ